MSELVKCNSVPDPSVNPFGYLWMINCILYSAVVAFCISKGWKKREEERNRAGRSKFKLKEKVEYEAKACKIRGNISRAKAELERIKLNKKIKKKGRKNRCLLEKECGTLSLASLISYMEKEKSKLRKLKRGYRNNKKREEARRLNKQFELDPGKVYFNLKKIIETQEGGDKPK